MHQSKSFALKDLYKAVRRIENLWFNVVFARDLFDFPVLFVCFTDVFSCQAVSALSRGARNPCMSVPANENQTTCAQWITMTWPMIDVLFFNFKVFQLGVDNALVVLHRYFSWQSLNDQSFLFASDGMHDSWQVIMKSPVTFHMNRKSLPSCVCVCVCLCAGWTRHCSRGISSCSGAPTGLT